MLVLRIKGHFEHEGLLTVRCKEITGFTFRPRLCFLTYAAVLRGAVTLCQAGKNLARCLSVLSY